MSMHRKGLSWTMGMAQWAGACVGASDEPGLLSSEDVATDIGSGDWCGATYEAVGLDEAVDGFDATPAEALASLEGVFVGTTDGVAVELALVVDGTVQVARVARYEADAVVAAEVVPVSVCADHLVLTGAMDLDGGALVGLQSAVDIAYFDGEDAGDGFGWDTASFALRTDTWDGDAAPSWDPAEMEVVEMVVSARWNGGVHEAGTDRYGTDVPASIWTIDASFWGESAPTGSGDDAAVWAGEEMLMTVDLTPLEG
jgi:hypothetical protein